MVKDWFHIPSLGRTIDFNVISDIDWNDKCHYDKLFRTLVYLGTSIAVGEEYGSERPHLSILDEEDRKALHAKFPGIPILLLFAEVIPEPESVVEPEDVAELAAFNAKNSATLPY